jgi:hypothetical protein
MQLSIEIAYEYSQYMLCLRRLEYDCATAKYLILTSELRRKNLSASKRIALLNRLRVLSIYINDDIITLGIYNERVRAFVSCKEFPIVREILELGVSRLRRKFVVQTLKRPPIWKRVFRRRESIMLTEIEERLLQELSWKHVLNTICQTKMQDADKKYP